MTAVKFFSRLSNVAIILLFILYSCRQTNTDNADIQLDKNLETLQVNKRYPSNAIREIVYYKDNRPIKNIGLTDKGDTIRFASVLKAGDSLFAFIPVNQFEQGSLLFAIDSASIILGRQPIYSIDINKSTMLKIVPQMYIEKDVIKGAFKFRMKDGTFEYWPFKTEGK